MRFAGSGSWRDAAWVPAWWLSYSCCLVLLMEEVVPCHSLAALLLYVNWHQSDSDSNLS
jgi:hypothetical protein